MKFIVDRLPLLRKLLGNLKDNGQALSKMEIGCLGERIAVRHLKKDGMKILYRNFRAPHGGEIDIIARDKQVLAFIEVKTRTNEKFGRPVEAVNMDKRFLITRGACEWLRMIDEDQNKINYRFDVVEVILVRGKKARINLIKGAFETPDNYLMG